MSERSLPRIALVTSNGWGLGHLSRETAIALAIGERAEVTMFTFSRGFPLAARFGLRGEYCPGQSSPWIVSERWDSYVERRFAIFLSEVEPDVVLFDGVAPYLGVINALRRYGSISAGWLRRGMWLAGSNDGQLRKSQAFDFVIEPGDIAAEADVGPTATLDSIGVPPVSLLEVVPALSRDEAVTALGLSPEAPTLLFALGTSQSGGVAPARDVAMQEALRHRGWQVGVVRSPLSEAGPGDVGEGSVDIAGVFPLSRYLAAFDAAISAAGYNSVHELIPARVPTLFIPKSASKTDDQVARASFLADQGLALMAREGNLKEVSTQVDSLLEQARWSLTARLSEVDDDEMMGGAAEVARILISNPPTGIRGKGDDGWRQPGLKGVVKRAMRPAGVEAVQRVLGRTPRRPARRPVSLDRKEGHMHLLVSEDPDDVSRSHDQPVEHLLAGASASYRKARRGLIGEFYDLVG